jgi:hypothetical protein
MYFHLRITEIKVQIRRSANGFSNVSIRDGEKHHITALARLKSLQQAHKQNT